MRMASVSVSPASSLRMTMAKSMGEAGPPSALRATSSHEALIGKRPPQSCPGRLGRMNLIEANQGGAENRWGRQLANDGPRGDSPNASAYAVEQLPVIAAEYATAKDHLDVAICHTQPANGGHRVGDHLIGELVDEAARHLVSPGGRHENQRRQRAEATLSEPSDVHRLHNGRRASHAQMGRHQALKQGARSAPVSCANR